MGNKNFKLILRQNSAVNTEILCRTIGTKKASNKTWSTDFVGRFKGMGVKEVEEFIIHPNVIKTLKTLEAVLLKKLPDTKVYQDINIRRVQIDTFEDENIEKEDIVFEEKENKKIESVNKNKDDFDDLDWSTD